MTLRAKDAKGSGKEEGRRGLNSLTRWVKDPSSRNPCVLAPLRRCVDSTVSFGIKPAGGCLATHLRVPQESLRRVEMDPARQTRGP
jgi:hypothetical protein